MLHRNEAGNTLLLLHILPDDFQSVEAAYDEFLAMKRISENYLSKYFPYVESGKESGKQNKSAGAQITCIDFLSPTRLQNL